MASMDGCVTTLTGVPVSWGERVRLSLVLGRCVKKSPQVVSLSETVSLCSLLRRLIFISMDQKGRLRSFVFVSLLGSRQKIQ